jgi:microcystin-dependent protein
LSQPYVGEIRMFGGNFAPAGWAFCNGQPLPISENEVLFQLIGTTYGGDGESVFNLPDLQSRVPMHQGTSHILGEMAGVESVTLTVNQIPSHSHPPLASTASGNSSTPNNRVWSESVLDPYSSIAPSLQMNANAIAPSGGSQPHDNLMPYLAISFILSLFGVFPTQS